MKTEAEWAAATIVTETNEPHEMLPIAWVLRRRLESHLFPKTIREIVLQPKQFSAWNPWTSGRFKGQLPTEEIWHQMMAALDQETREKLYPLALFVAELVLGTATPPNKPPAPAWAAPFGPGVCWYYSPISMVPKGQAPVWAASARRRFTPSGIDPERFVFCEDVR